MQETGAVILAGGQGSRFGKQKQFIEWRGKTLWRHVYDKTIQIIPRESIVVVGVDVPGGKTRSYSVRNGLENLPACKKVILLEAARPLVTIEQILQLKDNPAASITFVTACVDTIIKKNKEYLNRAECYRMLTPQAFDYELLKKAYATGKYEDMTDETRVMFEHYGIEPVLLETGTNLYKVTYPEDIMIMEVMCQQLQALSING